MALSVDKRIQQLKQDFVLQIYLGSGPFWENVKRARVVQSVRPGVRLPPSHISPPGSVSDVRELQSWQASVRGVWESVVPRAYREASDWDDFVAACLLYDPPEPLLEEFAQYGGTAPAGPMPSSVTRRSGTSTHTIEPAIEWIDSEGLLANAIEEFYQGVITELGKRFFEPRGYDVWQVVSDVYRETDLREELRKGVTQIETHPYIDVSKDMSEEDILRAASVIRNLREKNPGGRPSRGKLIAIKCAILYDERNGRDPRDRRRKLWSYERLGREVVGAANPDKPFDHPKRVGEEYVKLGRRLRSQRRLY